MQIQTVQFRVVVSYIFGI